MISRTTIVAALFVMNACSNADMTVDGGSDATASDGASDATADVAPAPDASDAGTGYDAPSFDATCADALANGATFSCGAQTCTGAVAQVCVWPRYAEGGTLGPVDAASCVATPSECTCSNTHVCACILAYIGDICDGATPKCTGGSGYNQAIVSCPIP